MFFIYLEKNNLSWLKTLHFNILIAIRTDASRRHCHICPDCKRADRYVGIQVASRDVKETHAWEFLLAPDLGHTEDKNGQCLPGRVQSKCPTPNLKMTDGRRIVGAQGSLASFPCPMSLFSWKQLCCSRFHHFQMPALEVTPRATHADVRKPGISGGNQR